jgi:hypothetical protein
LRGQSEVAPVRRQGLPLASGFPEVSQGNA